MTDKPLDTAESIPPNLKLPFKAQGNEPAWQLKIKTSQLELLQGYEQQTQFFNKTKLTPTETDKVLVTAGKNKQLTAVLTPSICHDSMSGMPHPWQVSISLDDKSLEGCGGDPLTLLIGEWQLEDINNQGIIDRSHLTIVFDENGQVYGSATCNRYGSSYKLTGEGLSFGPSLVTKMACPEALMNQEQKFLTVFNTISHFDLDATGALILKSHNGNTLRGYLLGQ